MKKVIFLLVLASVIWIPQWKPAQAIVSQESDWVGIDEATFDLIYDFHNATCRLEGYGSDEPLCPDALTQLTGIPIMRVFHFGEVYRITTSGAGGVFDVTVDRYLPDGFYQTSTGYWWVANGFKTKMKRGSAFSSIISRVMDDRQSYSPVSESDFEYFLDDCEELAAAGSNFWFDFWKSECDKGKILGHMNTDRFFGQIVMRVGANGELYWVNNKSNLTSDLVTPVAKQVGSHSFFFFVKKNSTLVADEIMDNIQFYPVSYPPNY